MGHVGYSWNIKKNPALNPCWSGHFLNSTLFDNFIIREDYIIQSDHVFQGFKHPSAHYYRV